MAKDPHKIEKLGMDVDANTDASPGDTNQANLREAHKLAIQRYIQALAHACVCYNDANCQEDLCPKMKRVFDHTKICKRKTKGDCPICKQLITLCCYHCQHCQETKCTVPFCPLIKKKMKQKQQNILQQQQQAPAPHQQPQPNGYQEALQQIMQLVRLPTNQNRQLKIVQILRSNPPLMAAYIRQRQLQGVGHVGARPVRRRRGRRAAPAA